MKVCPSCKEVGDLNRWGVCEACENDEREEDERQYEIIEQLRIGEITDDY